MGWDDEALLKSRDEFALRCRVPLGCDGDSVALQLSHTPEKTVTIWCDSPSAHLLEEEYLSRKCYAAKVERAQKEAAEEQAPLRAQPALTVDALCVAAVEVLWDKLCHSWQPPGGFLA